MKIKAFLILASVLLAPVSKSLGAEENITGAFGVKLGETLYSQEIENPELAFTYENDDTLSFYPDKKFRSFSTYVVKITPKTRKIYSISATEGMDDASTCEKEQALIMVLLTKKYGEKDPFSLYGQTISQDNRRVATQCIGLSEALTITELGSTSRRKHRADVTLKITYLDSKLAVLDKQAARIDMEPEINPRLTALALKYRQEDKRIDGAGLKMGAEQAATFLDRSYLDNSDSVLSPSGISRETGSPLGNVLVNPEIAERDFAGLENYEALSTAPVTASFIQQKRDERALKRSKFIKERIMFILSIIFFAISAIICWRVDREKCK